MTLTLQSLNRALGHLGLVTRRSGSGVVVRGLRLKQNAPVSI